MWLLLNERESYKLFYLSKNAKTYMISRLQKPLTQHMIYDYLSNTICAFN